MTSLESTRERLRLFSLTKEKVILKRKLRNALAMAQKQWSKEVHARDVLCQHCGTYKDLHAHHLLPRSTYPELAKDISNGKLLCLKCHALVHKADPIGKLMLSACG